ncbi:PD-(D/E)XK nuclease family protein [Acinetobacter venetianus]|uniref:PDDEXK-like family protein n=1 Tax=Acinetobacter venetianus TaxID=52133 RepID=UPI003A8F9182
MINQQFFDYLKLLRDKYAEKPKYNLFTVLRSDSDEVRLHSRFLADILNPKGSHNFGKTFVTEFLQRQSIHLKDNIKVDCEYKNIDILIRSQDTAVIIENKIYAGDQDRQLERYHQTMRNEGYQNIHLIYLTLDGSDPSAESVGSLTTEIKNLSYREDIHDWIERCTELAVRDAPLREAFIQYTHLINNLTNRVDNMEHIAQLKQLLLKDDNLLSITELNQAYEEIIVDAQLAMWEILGQKMSTQFGPLTSDSISNHQDPRACVKNYVQSKRNSKWIIQAVELRDYPSFYLYVEQDHHLYFGIACEDEKQIVTGKELPERSHSYHATEHNTFWEYPKKQINFKNLSAKDVLYLSDTASLESFTQQIVDELAAMYNLILEQ